MDDSSVFNHEWAHVGLFSDLSVGDLARVTVGKSISYMFLAFHCE
jgi:hypothetical protein